MAQIDAQLTTGLPSLDRVLAGLIPGDNIVWFVNSVDNYLPFVTPYCRAAPECGQKLIYFRFAKHPPLMGPDSGAEIHQLNPADGFEPFLTAIHETIEQAGRGGYYVFDCLSDLSADWYSDQMLGNFFMLTCPYLYDVEAIAYFALLRNCHSPETTGAISETAQVLINVFRHEGSLYIHPQKVQQRFSPTMYMLREWRDEDFPPVTHSAVISEILTSVPWRRVAAGSQGAGLWQRAFAEAREAIEGAAGGTFPPEKLREIFRRLVRMAISRDDRLFALVEQYMTVTDVIRIGNRMLGTGLIGGKSVGMLLARAILRRQSPRWARLLEPHDSFYIGSDVFYTFLVRNGIWWARQRRQDRDTFLQGAERARQSMIRGTFSPDIERQFADMLDYFGQSPIIVRSSSLLEDNFGNAFAGKYESVFCANQGSRDKRLADFMSAVRTIYASTMSEKALRYRAMRGLLDRDEQMALLVQRVSGSVFDTLFYPHIAGVGFSFNPYVWNKQIDAKAGMMRLVFGLGTRAVDRRDEDYTHVVALNVPHLRLAESFDKVRRYAQRKVDVLNLQANQLVSISFAEVAGESDDLPIELFATRDRQSTGRAARAGIEDVFPWVLTFDHLLSKTAFVADMRDMLQVLQQAYDYPVDVEFTANFFPDGAHKINLVQCRPLQVADSSVTVEPAADIDPADLILKAHGAVIGHSRVLELDRIVYVAPSEYGQLPVADRYAVARLIGRILHDDEDHQTKTILLMGPGRWGTTQPSLGVPASFSDISSVSVLCEIVAMRDDLVPDVSLGTHYFSDLVESSILYLALFPAKEGNFLNRDFFRESRNRLAELVPDAARWGQVVVVVDAADVGDDVTVKLHASNLDQEVACYLDHRPHRRRRGARK